MNKYTDARYPEKINDLIGNDGELSEEGKKVIEESGVAPSEEEISEIAKAAIEADKDVIAQIKIEYNEISGKTRFTFPQYVYPIKISISSGPTLDYYLFYDSSWGYTYVQRAPGDTTKYRLLWDNGNRYFEVDGQVNWSIANLYYIYQNRSSDFTTYYICNPTGTQLYLHTLRCNNNSYVCRIISTEKTSFISGSSVMSPGTPFEIGSTIITAMNKTISVYFLIDGVAKTVVGSYSGPQSGLYYLASDGTVTQASVGVWSSDAVTKL